MQALIAEALSVPTLSWPLRYSLTTLFVAVPVAIHLLFDRVIPSYPFRYPFVLFYPAIVMTGLVFNHGAIVFATLLSAVLTDFLFMEPPYTVTLAANTDTLALVIFILT